ncbi:MAG TPA: hypothetical protein VFV34_23190, partial [Blastocatellia bacterium]|nr:hypothetical protein [Blastocatellia bacterium]
MVDEIDPTPDLHSFASYERALRAVPLRVPPRFNIAEAIFQRHSSPTRPALIEAGEHATNTYTFGALDFLSDKFANVLKNAGIKSGDI